METLKICTRSGIYRLSQMDELSFTPNPSTVFGIPIEKLHHHQIKIENLFIHNNFTPIFFKWYGKQYSYVLKCFSRFFVQNEESKQLLAKIGVTNVDVVGDTRFDRVLQIKEKAKQLPIVDAFVGTETPCKVFVAGSSWPPDEDIFINFFNQHKDWKLIIAPHVIDDSHLEQILSKLDRKTIRYTQATPETAAQAECLLIDCFGLLSSIYHFGDVAYVGGGFGVGIHNVLEAAVSSTISPRSTIFCPLITKPLACEMPLNKSLSSV